MRHIHPGIEIPENEIQEEFIQAAGPGGQNVNKVATAVRLRFNVAESTALPPEVKVRLRRLAGRRMTESGILIIEAREYRTQEQNRQAALDRLVDLVRRAATPPKLRHQTRPTAASRLRRLEAKRKRAETKRLRQPKWE